LATSTDNGKYEAAENPFPLSELHNEYELNPDGSVGRFRTSQYIHDAIGEGALKRIIQIRMCPFWRYSRPQAGRRSTNENNEDEHAANPSVRRRNAGLYFSVEETLQNAPAGVRIVDVPGANHYLFISNEKKCCANCKLLADLDR
jgi:hypothetical protein